MMTLAPDSAWAVLGLLGNHLWQSTVVVVIAGLLILTVRQARAQVRYWIWLAASVKFLVPFGALVALGSQFSWRSAPVRPVANLTVVMDAISQPFAPQTFDISSAPVPPSAGFMTMLPIVLMGIWLLGTAVLLTRWLITWRRIAAIVREGTPVEQGRVTETLRRLERASGVMSPIKLVASTTTLEPGVFGIMRPVLLWSQSLAERLDDQQVEAILAHEVSHVKRRDNLTAALHMVVEALFWFHPLVWWLSARLVAERERACDEAVVQLGSDPHVYAAGILRMCEFYVESPLACVSGVTGADLKRRIEAIMRHPLGANLTAWRKVLLATVGITIIAGPVVMGLMNAQQLHAQTPTLSPTSLSFEVASVKPDKSTSPRDSGFGMPADRFEGKGLSLQALIATAYGSAGSPPRWLAEYQIAGGPKWMETNRFEVLAKAEGAIPEGTEGERRKLLMLRTLLAERFKLVVHHETRNVPIYALAVARADGRLGPKLHRVADDCAAVFAERRSNPRPSPQASDVQPRCLVMVGLGALTVQGQSMDAVADLFSRLAGRFVVNRTALKGAFDLELQFSPEGLPGLESLGAPPAGTSDAPSIFTAVQEQLGLKLVSTTGPVDVLVVDHAEPPADNQAAPASPSPVLPAVPEQRQAQLATLPPTTQEFSGSLLDPLGRSLTDTRLTLWNVSTQLSTDTRSDQTGRFTFNGIPPGDYLLSVSEFGLQGQISILPGQHLNRDIRLVMTGGNEYAVTVYSSETPSVLPPLPSPLSSSSASSSPFVGQAELDRCRQLSMFCRVSAPVQIAQAKPIYPVKQRNSGVGGAVVVEARVGTDGLMKALRAVAPADPDFASAALDAFRRWQFRPMRLDEVPVEMNIRATANFVVQ